MHSLYEDVYLEEITSGAYSIIDNKLIIDLEYKVPQRHKIDELCPVCKQKTLYCKSTQSKIGHTSRFIVVNKDTQNSNILYKFGIKNKEKVCQLCHGGLNSIVGAIRNKISSSFNKLEYPILPNPKMKREDFYSGGGLREYQYENDVYLFLLEKLPFFNEFIDNKTSIKKEKCIEDGTNYEGYFEQYDFSYSFMGDYKDSEYWNYLRNKLDSAQLATLYIDDFRKKIDTYDNSFDNSNEKLRKIIDDLLKIEIEAAGDSIMSSLMLRRFKTKVKNIGLKIKIKKDR